MRGTGALARASMADLKPDRVRAAELAQTGAGRGRARGEQAEREHESTRTLLEHDPDFITRGPRAGKKNEEGSSRNIVNASVAAAAKEEAQFAEEEARWAAFKGREWALTLTCDWTAFQVCLRSDSGSRDRTSRQK